MFISFNMFILLIVATILMIFLIIYLTVTGNDKIIKETKERNKRTTPTLNKNNCSPSQKPNVVTDVAKRASQKSKPYNEHSNQPLERTRLLNLHEANVIMKMGVG